MSHPVNLRNRYIFLTSDRQLFCWNLFEYLSIFLTTQLQNILILHPLSNRIAMFMMPIKLFHLLVLPYNQNIYIQLVNRLLLLILLPPFKFPYNLVQTFIIKNRSCIHHLTDIRPDMLNLLRIIQKMGIVTNLYHILNRRRVN